MSRLKVRLPDGAYWADRVPCQMASPVHTDAGRYVQSIAAGDDADGLPHRALPEPARLGLRARLRRPLRGPLPAREVRRPGRDPRAQAFVTERFGVESREPDTLAALAAGATEPGNKWGSHQPVLEAEARGAGGRRKVAVVGAGPAGVACAHDLALMGYAVTVFEASRRAGGMAFHGIPDFRLPPTLLDKEVHAVEAMGVEFRFESPLTRERGLEALRARGSRRSSSASARSAAGSWTASSRPGILLPEMEIAG